MKRRFRLTGFARFFIVMLFVIPLAYLGASYYRGEDGIQNIKNLLGLDKGTTATVTREPGGTSAPGIKNATGSELQEMKARIEALEKENRDLKVKIRDLELELKATKMQLENRSKSGGR